MLKNKTSTKRKTERKKQQMTIKKKLIILEEMEEKESLCESDFTILKTFVVDKNAFIRSQTAALLINFKTSESMNLLLLLSNDYDSYVRTEAYDSLSVFIDLKVEEKLYSAVNTEKNELARSYAILSWADVAFNIHSKEKLNEYLSFSQKKISEEKFDICRLSYYYSMYLFGKYAVINDIIAFLNNTDCSIRCNALNILSAIISKDNKKVIKNAIDKLLLSETILSVKELANNILHDIYKSK